MATKKNSKPPVCIYIKQSVEIMATIAVGDIHGHLNELRSLIKKIAPELCSNDTLVFLGDYIDRGPESRGCIEYLVRLRENAHFEVVTLMGNHEQWLLRTKHDYTRHSWLLSMEGLSTIASYSVQVATRIEEEIRSLGERLLFEAIPLSYGLFFEAMPTSHQNFFKDLQPHYRAAEVVCTHGGLDPGGGAVESQKTERLIWGARGFPADYYGVEPIAYGHWDNAVIDEFGHPWPCIQNNTFGLDTISCGVLTAVRFPDLKVFQSDLT